MKQFPLTRIYSDENGDSHFEDMFVPMNNAGDIGALSETRPVKGIIFREVEPSYDYNFHNAPQKQYIILLDGGIEIQVILKGMDTHEEIDGETYSNTMAPFNYLTDQQIADVLTYIRNSFGNKATVITPGDVKYVRARMK